MEQLAKDDSIFTVLETAIVGIIHGDVTLLAWLYFVPKCNNSS